MIDMINCPYPGEMLPLERLLLYNAVMDNRPKIILEVGSGEGASTYYLAEGAHRIKDCKIFTCDPTRSPTEEFLRIYPNVTYIPRNGVVLIDSLIKQNLIPNFVFFDGPEDPEVALKDFQTLDPFLGPSTIFCMHDWCTEKRLYDGNISTKAALLKPYIKSLDTWQWIDELYGDRLNLDLNGEGCDSVGIAFYRKIGP